MVWLTLYDDYYEVCPVHELAGISNHIMDVMIGQPWPEISAYCDRLHYPGRNSDLMLLMAGCNAGSKISTTIVSTELWRKHLLS